MQNLVHQLGCEGPFQCLSSYAPQVENPIAYEEDRMTRMLSMGHLHASYAWLLVAPWRLSADYSHACIPLLHSLYDPRNAFTAALYGLLAHQMLRGLKPVSRVIAASLGPPSPPLLSQKIIANQNHGRDTQQDCGSNHSMPISASEAAPATASAVTTAATVKAANFARREAVAVWRVFMIVALVIAPFVPSSNVLFYVGTFIGERLLYLPSIGYCMLVGQAVVSFAGIIPQRLLADICFWSSPRTTLRSPICPLCHFTAVATTAVEVQHQECSETIQGNQSNKHKGMLCCQIFEVYDNQPLTKRYPSHDSTTREHALSARFFLTTHSA
jgi:hypothetical protein